jgi:hypothetical protein
VWGQHHAPATFAPGKDPVPIVQEAGWAPEPVWIGAENLATPGFEPRTFQPAASRYTDYAIPALPIIIIIIIPRPITKNRIGMLQNQQSPKWHKVVSDRCHILTRKK